MTVVVEVPIVAVVGVKPNNNQGSASIYFESYPTVARSETAAAARSLIHKDGCAYALAIDDAEPETLLNRMLAWVQGGKNLREFPRVIEVYVPKKH